jgi:hypothetical protein
MVPDVLECHGAVIFGGRGECRRRMLFGPVDLQDEGTVFF